MGVIAAAIVIATSTQASAQAEPAGAAGSLGEPPPVHEPERSASSTPPSRVVGLGTAFGVGGAVATSLAFGASANVAAGVAVEIPTLEGHFFVDDHLAIDVSIPLWNMVVVGAFARIPVLAATVYLDFSLGDDWVRFVCGPGLGFSHVQVGTASATEIRVAGLAGLELLSRGRLFGFRVMTRPFVGVAIASGSGAAMGGGALLELELISYATNG